MEGAILREKLTFMTPHLLTNDEFWYKYHQNQCIGSKVALFLRYWLFHSFTSSPVIQMSPAYPYNKRS